MQLKFSRNIIASISIVSKFSLYLAVSCLFQKTWKEIFKKRKKKNSFQIIFHISSSMILESQNCCRNMDIDEVSPSGREKSLRWNVARTRRFRGKGSSYFLYLFVTHSLRRAHSFSLLSIPKFFLSSFLSLEMPSGCAREVLVENEQRHSAGDKSRISCYWRCTRSEGSGGHRLSLSGVGICRWQMIHWNESVLIPANVRRYVPPPIKSFNDTRLVCRDWRDVTWCSDTTWCDTLRCQASRGYCRSTNRVNHRKQPY